VHQVAVDTKAAIDESLHGDCQMVEPVREMPLGRTIAVPAMLCPLHQVAVNKTHSNR
jgi:hypothetical protein